jgi:hypothetical protein
MQTDLSNEPTIGDGSYIRLDNDYYRVGVQNDFKTEPPTIGINSTWGLALKGKRPGDEVRLIDRSHGRRQPDYITCRISEVRPCAH